MDEMPSRGAVWVGGTKSPGVRPTAIPQLRRKLGVVFQDFLLLDDRTVEQNVAFALEVVDTPRERIGSKVSRLLTRVGLASKATNYPRELSGGEQQRVAIARALVNDPFVLIADEPTGNLDDRATRGVFQLLKDINASGTAVIMATHNLELVRRNEYRVLEMNRGQLVFDSSEQAGAPGASMAEAPRPETRTSEARMPEARMPEARMPGARTPEPRTAEPQKPEPQKQEPQKPEAPRVPASRPSGRIR
jgi:cell division transport system ATP-binding protein